MGVKKYTNLYMGARSHEHEAPTTSKEHNKQQDKLEIEQLKKAIADRFKDPEQVKKAARIIEEMLNR
ncbi:MULTISPECIES: hypothetical protein [Halobacteriovorax]|uniref:Anti-sigma-28 factor FlgM C-terminal domain-containing protein n=1 Tax=Halobacteriovorax vibrionivorans TaxID=2152716 RepID=A0ABY0IGK0_9BACT|nr:MULTISPECIES: hypothetical protein [Halobacteriovorax]AYF43349.1 hypothetical protein BALOs_0334 [Halobacteriovorax sp. BALOs_7]RZF22076.1 hypothetical protein DAY19_10365 [Halobacteriovorax vibrionivorans]TGD46963.1 hypothetical protein EP118_10040 [Halobacteriovorax sp. Y22]